MPDHSNASALGDVRVLDVAGEMGLYCVKLLADLGADVIKVEPPGGGIDRRRAPFKADKPSLDSSLYYLYYNTNKRGITLDLSKADGAAIFRRLAKSADIVVETHAPGTMASYGLDYESLSLENSGLVMVSITGFGQSGPRRNFKSSDLIGFAWSSIMNASGQPGKEPCTAPGQFAYAAASVHAAVGVMIALHHRSATGKGQYIDVSVQEATQALDDCFMTRYSSEGIPIFRTGNKNPILSPCTLYPAKDGYVWMTIIRKDHWRELVNWMGRPDIIVDDAWEETPFRAANQDIVDMVISDFTRDYTRNELYEEGQRRHLPVTPMNTPADFAVAEQPVFRGLFKEVDFPQTGKVKWFVEPLRLQASPATISRRPPFLGEHNSQIYGEELGLSNAEIVSLAAAGVI